jgi:hypothetical protein
MEVKIKDIKQEFFVDEEGLYSNILIDILVKPDLVPEFINLSFTVLPSSSLN